MAANGSTVVIEETENERYDRQMRLWGKDAQQRLQQTRLVVVNLGGVGSEVVKNLTLAGVGAIHIQDKHAVLPADLSANCFLRDGDVGRNRAEASHANVQALNPFVKVTCDAADPATLPDAFWQRFDVVCLCDCPLDLQVRVNAVVRQAAKPQPRPQQATAATEAGTTGLNAFVSVNAFGILGCFFQDLGDVYHYQVKDPKAGDKEESQRYIPLSAVYECADWKRYRPTQAYLACQTLLPLVGRTSVGTSEVAPPTVAELQEARQGLADKHKVALGDLGDDLLARLTVQAWGDFAPISAVVGGQAAQELLKIIQRNAQPLNHTFVFDGLTTFNGVVERVGHPQLK
eukprot:TRINITY_DN10664_c0_g1_i1.p1 TRINITY_DN10664_c0_g1~~TRINITY_DN10664_c0_g1_i1.p1  ORF type:complete len:355 (-),score=75.70 TRINITY_DN10664_c0_g1_i1:42-1076(-)